MLSVAFDAETLTDADHASHRVKLAVFEVVSFAVDLYQHPANTSAIFPDSLPGRNERRLQRALAERFERDLLVGSPAVAALAEQMAYDGFHLLYGPRGVGKTTLLRGLRHQESLRDRKPTPTQLRAIREAFTGELPWRVSVSDLRFDTEANILLVDLNYRELKAKAQWTLPDGAITSPTGESQVANALFEVAYGRLYDRLRQLDLLVAYHVYRFNSHSYFATLRHDFIGQDLYTTPDQRLYFAGRVRSNYVTLQSAFEHIPAMDRLQSLCEFYHAVLATRVVLAVDNLDQAGSAIQLRALRTLMQFASTTPPNTVLVACRPSVQAQLTGDRGTDLPTYILHMKYSDAMGTPPVALTLIDVQGTAPADAYSLDEPDADASATSPLFMELIRRRLRLLRDIMDGKIEEGGAADVGQSLSHDLRALDLDSPSAFTGRVWTECSIVYQDEEGTSTYGRSSNGLFDLLQWHNGSIRSAASHLVYLVTSLLTARDGVLGGPRTTLARAVRAYDSKNLFYRSMILGPRRPPESLATPQIYRGDFEAVDRTVPPFQRLILLSYLNRLADGIPYLDLVERWNGLGLDGAALDMHLRALLTPRGFESEGLIRVDTGFEGDADADTRDINADVELLDAGMLRGSKVYIRLSGKWFVQHLAHSVEYLFWSAFYSDERIGVGAALRRAGLIDQTEDQISGAGVREDALRLVVALVYIRDHLLERYRCYLDDVATSSGSGAIALGTVRSKLRPFYGARYDPGNEIDRMLHQAQAFLNKIDTSVQAQREATDLLRSARLTYSELFGAVVGES